MRPSPNRRAPEDSVLARLLHSLEANLQLAAKAADAGQVHDLRVATRRFAQALYVFAPAIQGADKIRRELKPLMNAAGEVRDFDIAIKMVAKDDAAGDPNIVADLERKRAKAQSRLANELQRIAASKSIERWRARISTHTRSGDPGRSILLTARHFFRRGARAERSNATPKDLHRLRIAAKKLRYTLELRPAAIPAKMIGRIEQLQSGLGHVHDFDAVRDLLKDYSGSKKLRHAMRRKQRELTREFPIFWDGEFGGKKNHARWMSRIERFAGAFQPVERKPAVRVQSASRIRTA